MPWVLDPHSGGTKIYSHEMYEPTMFDSGQFFGTPEEGFDVGGVYLDN